ncbi:MAG: MlaD family protein [Candidatus Omnitrophota bacterium]
MARKANKSIIGAFVVGAVVLLAAAILVFGSGAIFKRSDKYVLFFDGSVKGLSEGAPVIFRGVKIGAVKDIGLEFDSKTDNVLISVVIDVELSRVKGTNKKLGFSDYRMLIKQGLRARLEIQNFITSQLMLSLDFYPDKPEKIYGLIKDYPELPALPISPDIFEIMDEIPIKAITDNLEQAVSGLNRLVNSEGIFEVDRMLREVTQTARSMRLFIEYLEQHPEALLKGKTTRSSAQSAE